MLVGERAGISLSNEIWKGDPEDEGRARANDRGIRLVIEWISKGWTIHEMQLPVFYRESLATVLTLEKLRNLIETNKPI
jgi:hypothetical protein